MTGTEKCTEVDNRRKGARTDDRRRPGGCRYQPKINQTKPPGGGGPALEGGSAASCITQAAGVGDRGAAIWNRWGGWWGVLTRSSSGAAGVVCRELAREGRLGCSNGSRARGPPAMAVAKADPHRGKLRRRLLRRLLLLLRRRRRLLRRRRRRRQATCCPAQGVPYAQPRVPGGGRCKYQPELNQTKPN